MRILNLIFIFLFSFSFVLLAENIEIVKKIKKLHIGLNNYFIGEKFNGKAQKIKGKTYPGTIKYKDKDLFITVAKNSNIVIGLYKNYKNANIKELKQTISFLMLKFGEPTLEAHDKNIYWFFNENGKISRDTFLEMKKKHHISQPLIMIKFNVNAPLSQINKIKKKVDFYFIIYSETLMRELVLK